MENDGLCGTIYDTNTVSVKVLCTNFKNISHNTFFSIVISELSNYISRNWPFANYFNDNIVTMLVCLSDRERDSTNKLVPKLLLIPDYDSNYLIYIFNSQQYTNLQKLKSIGIKRIFHLTIFCKKSRLLLKWL